MNALPAPFTPSDCDLRGYEWMPLFGGRLFTSNFEAHASDLAFRVAIRLYWECWQQVPAASLPNDDVQLCRLGGLGRDLKTWRKLRADGVLHGFILCNDDRLYHGLIADEAVKAWECRQRKDRTRDRTADRTRQWRERKRDSVTRHNGAGDASHNASRDVGGDAGVTRDVTSRAVDRTVQYKTKGAPKSPPPSGAGDAPAGAGDPYAPDGFGQKFGTRADGTNPRARGTNPRNRPSVVPFTRPMSGPIQAVLEDGFETLTDEEERQAEEEMRATVTGVLRLR